jgi:hypothetical protein
MAYQITYEAYDATDPMTKLPVRCGRIINKRKMDLYDLVDRAIENGDLNALKRDEGVGVIRAILRAARQYLGESYIVDLGLVRLQLTLKGQLNDNDGISSKNWVKTLVQATDELKFAMSEISWTSTKSVAKVSIANVAWNGSKTGGEIKKDENIVATGTNLMFDAAIGDSVTFEYGGETVSCSIDGSGYQMISIAWPAELSEAAVGTEIAFKFTLHGGDADVTPKVITKKVKIVA